MAYVDGFVIAVPRRKMKQYVAMAKMGKKMWMKLGALDYKECVADDLKVGGGMTPFDKMIGTKPGETIVFSYVLYKSKAHRDRVNREIMKQMAQSKTPMEMPFEMKRMTMGGFKVIVSS